MSLAQHRPTAERRATIFLLVALAFLGLVVVGRLWSGWVEPGSPGRSPAAIAPSSAANIEQLQARLRRNPDNSYTYAQLGLAYLLRHRETADPTLYALAEQAFDEALRRDPDQLDALIGQGALALSRHDFRGALRWADQARALNPYRAEIYGLMVDAYVELGNYEAATATAQAMVDLRPGVSSYSRAAYLRELHGNVDGALAAMQAAADAAVPGSEARLWSLYQLGNLRFGQGEWAGAESDYRAALRERADYPYALAGLARLQAAQGDTAGAIAAFQGLAARLPLPEFVITLGDLYTVTGQAELARQQYELVEVMQALNAAAGMDVDLELALFEADRGLRPAETAVLARQAYERRPGIYAADTLAWALYQNGQFDEAWTSSQAALRLGTRDALLHFHAGMIAQARGDAPSAAHHLAEALAINPAFSIRHAPAARQALDELRPAPGR